MSSIYVIVREHMNPPGLYQGEWACQLGCERPGDLDTLLPAFTSADLADDFIRASNLFGYTIRELELREEP